MPDLGNVFHVEQYALLLDHLAKSTVQSDCLVAICGADGCGKTTLLNRFLLSQGDEVCVARLDDSYKGVREFYREILRQLGFHDIDGKPEELRRITREFIVNRGMANEPVLLVIDNAHLISPFILEQLRWLSAIKVDDARVLSCVLAGNSDLMRVMDSSAMSQFSFRNYIRFYIRAYSEAETAGYVWCRLKFAGCTDRLQICDSAMPLIHRFSGGIPRLINILCDAVLQEAYSREAREITAEMLQTVAERRHLVPHVLAYAGKGRRRSDPDFDADDVEIPHEAPDAGGDGPDKPRAVEDVDSEHLWAAGETSGLRQQVSELSKKLAELKGENGGFRQELESRNGDIRQLEDALQNQSRRYAKLEEAFDEKSSACDRLTRTLEDRVRTLKRSEETNRHLVDTLREDQEKLADLRARLASAAADRQTIKALQYESKKLRLKLAEADRNRKLIARLEREKDELSKQLETAEADREKIASLERENGELNARLEEGRSDKETIAALERRVADLQGGLDAARADGVSIAALEEEASQLRKQVADSVRDGELIASLREELDSLKARLADTTADREVLSGLQAELDQSREQNANRAEEISRLQSELSDALEALGNLEHELDSSIHAATELEERAEAGERDAKRQAAIATDLEAIVQTHDQEVAVLQSRIDELDSELLAAADRLSQFASLEACADQRDAELSELRSQLEQAQQELRRSASHAGSADAAGDADSDTAEQPIAVRPGASRARIRTIEVFHGDVLQQILRVREDQTRVMIGRDSDNDLVLESNFISRHHAIITFRDDGAACIEDLNSLNGIVVNKAKLPNSELNVGDVIILGDFCLLPGPA